MKQRRYAVDDVDFDDYKRSGGAMSRADFFNSKLTGTFTDSISKRLADHLGEPVGSSAKGLTQRITATLSERG